MQVFRRRSDAELVAELVRNMPRRRPAGWSAVVLGIVLLAVSLASALYVSRKISTISDDLSQIHHVTDEIAFKSAANLSYSTGIRIGILIGQAAVSGPLLVIFGGFLIFGGRKERLLIASFTRSERG